MSHFGAPVSYEKANDPLFRMRAYRLAMGLLEVAWQDAKTLSSDPVTERISGQLYAAISSVGSNIGEGYSRSSGRTARAFSNSRWGPSVRAFIGTKPAVLFLASP